jgi:hypothetical protein
MTGSGGVGNLICAKPWPFRASAGRLERKALFRMETQLHASIAETLDVLLARLATREPGALDALVCATQADLRRIAHRERLAMGGSETLSTTALVNEATYAYRKFKRPFRPVCRVGRARASAGLGTDRSSVRGVSAR